MNRAVAEHLLPVVNDPHDLAALMAYVNERLEIAYRDIGAAQDLRTLGMLQGRIHELEKLRGLRDTVLAMRGN